MWGEYLRAGQKQAWERGLLPWVPSWCSCCLELGLPSLGPSSSVRGTSCFWHCARDPCTVAQVRSVGESPWDHRGEGPCAGGVKGVSRPHSTLSPRPSRFILSPGASGDRLEIKGPSGGGWDLGGLWGPSEARTLLFLLSPSPIGPPPPQDDSQRAHRAALWQ